MKYVKLLLSSGLLVIILILGVGCQAVTSNSIETVKKGFERLAEVTMYSSQLSLNADGVDPQDTVLKFTLKSGGRTDTKDKLNVRMDTTVSVAFDTTGQNARGTFDIKSGDGSLYFRISDVLFSGGALEQQIPLELLQPFMGQWFYIVLPPQEDQSGNALVEQQLKIKELFRQADFFKKAVLSGEETLRGQKMQQFAVTMDKKKLQKFMQNAADISSQPFSSEQQTQLTHGLNNFTFKGDVWVGVEDFAVHRIKGVISSEPDEGGNLTVDFDVEFWDFNKPFEIEVPEGAVLFDSTKIQPLPGTAMPGVGAPNGVMSPNGNL